jgi:hypothetical protein
MILATSSGELIVVGKAGAYPWSGLVAQVSSAFFTRKTRSFHINGTNNVYIYKMV